MSTFLIFCALAALIIQIWLIALFVRMSADVKDIHRIIQNNYELPTISTRDALLAVILNEQDETYKKIVRKLYYRLSDLCNKAQYSYSGCEAEANEVIELASDMCKAIGRELPKQLSSFEAYKSYLKQKE
ncbi:MAG: hypothetical protein K2K69_06895 [Muribaculaceae bacterium]|nr:hypothetical protein [Muribaculaceae bacterium]